MHLIPSMRNTSKIGLFHNLIVFVTYAERQHKILTSLLYCSVSFSVSPGLMKLFWKLAGQNTGKRKLFGLPPVWDGISE